MHWFLAYQVHFLVVIIIIPITVSLGILIQPSSSSNPNSSPDSLLRLCSTKRHPSKFRIPSDPAGASDSAQQRHHLENEFVRGSMRIVLEHQVLSGRDLFEPVLIPGRLQRGRGQSPGIHDAAEKRAVSRCADRRIRLQGGGSPCRLLRVSRDHFCNRDQLVRCQKDPSPRKLIDSGKEVNKQSES